LKVKDGKVYIWFFACILGAVAVVPLHFLSVEHLKLEEEYGKVKGARIGEICGLISGWGLFFFWMGIWVSPQPRFDAPILQNLTVSLPVIDYSICLPSMMIGVPFLVLGTWLAMSGLKEVTLKAAEIHRTERIVKPGVYSVVRHPQYGGGLLAHIGITFLLSVSYSLLSTPLMIVIIYLISRKEEEELVKEFGKEYQDYKEKVPMLTPKLRG